MRLDAAYIATPEGQPLGPDWWFRDAGGFEARIASTLEHGFPPGAGTRGRFSLDIEVPAQLVERTFAIFGRFTGAGDLFLDGARIASWGTLSSGTSDGHPAKVHSGFTNPDPVPVLFSHAGLHRLEIEYENPAARRFAASGWIAGFRLALGDGAETFRSDLRRGRSQSALLWGFVSLFVGFGVLHLLLWRLDRSRRASRDLGLICFSAAALVFLLLFKLLSHRPGFILWSEPIMNAIGAAFPLSGLVLVYGITRVPPKAPPRRRLAIASAVAIGLSLWGFVQPAQSLPFLFFAMLVGFLEMLRESVVHLRRREVGGKSLAAGVALLSAGFALGLLSNLGVIPRTPIFSTIVPFASVAALILCASVSLSQWFHAAARSEREMEEARRLQLAMLPAKFPVVPGLSLAAAMETASRVGGDFYDARQCEGAGGALDLIVADATGHGAQAGALVAVMKGLFGASRTHGGTEFLTAANEALLRLGLRPLAIAATWIRIEGSTLSVASAGTPPPLLVSAQGETQTLGGGGVPLGLMRASRYSSASVDVAPGSTLVLFTDGLPESAGAGGSEELGYEATEHLVRKAVVDSPSAEETVASIRKAARIWRGTELPEDDISIVAIRWEEPRD